MNKESIKCENNNRYNKHKVKTLSVIKCELMLSGIDGDLKSIIYREQRNVIVWQCIKLTDPENDVGFFVLFFKLCCDLKECLLPH